MNVLSIRSFSVADYSLWLVGLALLCITARISIVELPEMRLRNGQFGLHIQSLSSDVNALIQPATVVSQVLPDWYAQLAGRERIFVILADLQAKANKSAVVLSNANYKLQDVEWVETMGRSEISVNLKGAYIPLKKMLADLLATHDGLALEFVSLHRTRSTDSIMDIEVHFSFFYRKQA